LANSYVEYTGNGSTTTYAIPFPFLEDAHVIAEVNGVTTSITVSGGNAVFGSAPASSAVIRISRSTSPTTRLVDYTSPSTLTEEILDTDSLQAFYLAQESNDTAGDSITKDVADLQWNAQSKRIKSVANPTADQDAVTKHYLENTWLSTSDKANVTTVSGISSNVSTVAGIASNVTAVAADASDIGAVAGKATEIGRLGTSDAVTDLNTLGTADVVSDMNTLATSANVTAMDNCSGSISNINTVSGSISNVNTVAGSISNVNTVAGKDTEIGLLGTSDAVADMNTLGTSDIVSDMNTLATSGNVTAMDNCSGSISNINTVSGSISNVNTVAGSISNVNTTASNITDVNTFANRYRIASSDPSSSLDEGDLVYNSTDNVLKYYNGSAWVGISGDTDVKVLVSSNDTTAGYLNGKLVAGEGVDFTEGSDGGDETLTISGEDASTSNKGVASFSSTFFDVSSGAVSIKNSGVDTDQLAADAVDATKIADDAISEEHLDNTAVTGFGAETVIAQDDLILISDTSASAALKKMTRENFVQGLSTTGKSLVMGF